MQDLDFGEVYEQLSSSRSMYEGLDELHLQNGILYHLNALCVPIGERIGLVRETHTSKIAGHFWGWKDIVQFVNICILAKDARSSFQIHMEVFVVLQ